MDFEWHLIQKCRLLIRIPWQLIDKRRPLFEFHRPLLVIHWHVLAINWQFFWKRCQLLYK